MIYTLVRYFLIIAGAGVTFGVAKGFYDVGEPYIDFSAFGLIRGCALLLALALAIVVLAIARDLGWQKDEGGFR